MFQLAAERAVPSAAFQREMPTLGYFKMLFAEGKYLAEELSRFPPTHTPVLSCTHCFSKQATALEITGGFV